MTERKTHLVNECNETLELIVKSAENCVSLLENLSADPETLSPEEFRLAVGRFTTMICDQTEFSFRIFKAVSAFRDAVKMLDI